MTEKQRIIVGLAWYRAEDWEEIRRISMDADKLDETHDAWMRSAEVPREQMRRAGTTFTRSSSTRRSGRRGPGGRGRR